jgi:hypothetical protein
MDFRGSMSIERWREVMHTLQMWKTASTVWLADAITYGRDHFGQAEVEDTLTQMEFDLMDAQRAIGIGTLDRDTRHAELNSEHYWVLAKAQLSTDEQIRWASLAVKHKLTAALLGKSITAGKVITPNESSLNSGRGSGIATVQGFRQLFDTWFRKVDQDDPIQKWPETRKRELLEVLKGPVRLGLQLARALGVELEAR